MDQRNETREDIYDGYMNRIVHYRPTDTKHKMFKVLKVVAKDSHIYRLNKDLKKLIKSSHEEKLYISDKYVLNKCIGKKVKYVKSLDDVVDCIKENPEDDIIFINDDLHKIIFELRKNRYEPTIYFRSCGGIFKLTFSINDKYYIIERSDITALDDSLNIIDENEYYRNHEVNKQCYQGLIYDELKSEMNDKVIEIEDCYKINVVSGYFIQSDLMLNGLDCKKSYSSLLRDINKVPVFRYFDNYVKYDNSEINEFSYYIVKCLDDTDRSNIIFSDRYSRVYGFVLKQIDMNYEVLYERRPSKIEVVDYKTVVDNVYDTELDDSDKKYIINKTTGLLELKYNKRHSSRCFDDYAEAHYYKMKNGGDIIPIYDYEYVSDIDDYGEEYEHKKVHDKMYIVNHVEKRRLSEGFTPIKEMIYCLQKLKLLDMYDKLDDVIIHGIKTDCILYEGERKVKFDYNSRFGYKR